MGPVEGLSCPWGRGGFPEQQLALQISCLFSFIPCGSLAERSLCLLPMSPSPSCHYSPREAGIAWEVRLELDPGSVGQRLLTQGLEPVKTAALQTPGELAEEQRLLQELHLALDRALRWPWVLAVGTSSSSMGEGQVILVQILPDPRGRWGIGVSSPAGQQGRTRTPRGPRLFLS